MVSPEQFEVAMKDQHTQEIAKSAIAQLDAEGFEREGHLITWALHIALGDERPTWALWYAAYDLVLNPWKMELDQDGMSRLFKRQAELLA